MKPFSASSLLATLALLLGPFAVAQQGDERVPLEFRSCSSIKRNSERLACYDRAVAALRSGTPVSRAASPESNFGLLTSVSALPPAAADGTSESSGDVSSIKAAVKGFGRSSDGARVYHLDNGQSWAQISGGETLLRVGDPVTINRAALGSFQMLVPSGRSAKVRRVN